jgi:SAM-dependent methyltransferase
MIAARFLRNFLLTLCFSLIAVCAFAQAQQESREFQPTLGQEGKDVIWLPTAQALADKMLNLAIVTPQDYVIDLGSGDGRIVIAAAKRGARALGIEYDPNMVALSKRNAAKEGVSDKAQFVKADLFESDFSQATVITMFLLPDINLKLRPAILNLRPGTRIASNSFDMGEWEPDQTVSVSQQEGCDNNYCKAYLWIVPAKVEGTWKLPQGELALKQNFQMISGALKTGVNAVSIANGRMYGDQISFSVGDTQYTGRVVGNAMSGAFKSGGRTGDWNASRVDSVVR